MITTNYVWDGQNMVYEYNGTNTIGGTVYYYGLTLISQGNYAYYLYNGHGDVVQLVTSSGTLGRSYDYDAFGNEVSPSATDTNPFRYAGQYFDSETGTYYLRARYYDPGIGRFTQQDKHWNVDNIIYGDNSRKSAYTNTITKTIVTTSIPDVTAIMQSVSKYTYALNSPIMYQDYNGESVILTCVIIGAVAGGLAGGGIGAYASHKSLGYVNGWWVAGGVVGGAAVGGLAGWGVGSVVVNASWTTASSMAATSSAAIGKTFEKWIYEMYNISKNAQQVVVKGIGRIDAFAKGIIYELKNYSWQNYSTSQINSIAKKFVEQGNRYMQITSINGQKVKGVTFYFSEKPPQIIIDALKNIGAKIDWVPGK